MNSLDPPLTDGKYQINRFKELTKERYLITKNTSTSYAEVGNMTPIERSYVLEFLADEAKKNQEKIDQMKKKNNKTNNNPNYQNSSIGR